MNMTLTRLMLQYLSDPEAHKSLTEAGESYEIQDLESIAEAGQPPTSLSDRANVDVWQVRQMAQAGLWALGRAQTPESRGIQDDSEVASINASGVLLANLWYAVAKESQQDADSFERASLSSELGGMPALSRALADCISLGPRQPQESCLEEALVALLQRRILRCKQVALDQLNVLSWKNEEDVGFADQPWWQGEVKCSQGLRLFADAILGGRERNVAPALALVDEGNTILADGGFFKSASHSSAIAKAMRSMWNSSIWKCLGVERTLSPIWRRYAGMLARGNLSDPDAPGIYELWTSQQEVVERGLLGDRDIVVHVPTGSGKTLIAELAIVAGLAEKPNTKCLFIAPFRALADEVLGSLAKHLGALGYHVAQDLGPLEYPSRLGMVPSRDTDILVTTPERARMLLNIDPTFFQNVSTVVLDELHLATEGNGERGVLYETLIARLTRKCPNARFVGMSALLSEQTLDDMSAWLSNKHLNSGVVASSDWHPTQSEILECLWLGDADAGKLLLRKGQRDTAAREVPSALGSIDKPSGSDLEMNKSGVCALLARVFAKRGPVLVYCPQKNLVDSVAKSLESLLSSCNSTLTEDVPSALPPSNRLRESFEEWRGADSPELRWLAMGFATHHAGLPQPLRAAVEDDFRDDRLRCLVATGTLGAGVNLPVDTIVFHSVHRFDPTIGLQGMSMRIRPEEFWNVAGRAGRPGRLEPGRVVYVSKNSGDSSDLIYFLNHRDDTASPLKSQMFRALTSSNLDHVSDALDFETITILGDPIDSQQMVASSVDVWRSTLAYVEAAKSNIDPSPLLRMMQQKEEQLAASGVTQPAAATWSKTGLSSQSCSQLDRASETPQIQQLFKTEENPSVKSALQATLPLCLDISECRVDESHRQLILDLAPKWVAGATFPDLLSYATQAFDVPEKKILTLLHEVIQYRLPWVLSGLLTICAQDFGVALDALPDNIAYLSSMVKLGLPSPGCCRLVSAGIDSRHLILALEKARSLNTSSADSDIVEWLASLDFESVQKLGLSGRDWQNLVTYYSSPEVGAGRLRPDESDYLPRSFNVQVNLETGTALGENSLKPGSVLALHHVYSTDEKHSKLTLVGIAFHGVAFASVPHSLADVVALDLDAGVTIQATCSATVSSADGVISRISVLLQHLGRTESR